MTLFHYSTHVRRSCSHRVVDTRALLTFEDLATMRFGRRRGYDHFVDAGGDGVLLMETADMLTMLSAVSYYVEAAVDKSVL